MNVITEAMKIDWDAVDFTEVRPHVSGATVELPQLTVTLYRYDPGASWEGHEHPEDQVTLVLEGGPITFTCDGETVEADTGDTLLIPGGTRHSAEVPGGRVVTLNIFPPREYRP